jgi:hypothetical protein
MRNPLVAISGHPYPLSLQDVPTIRIVSCHGALVPSRAVGPADAVGPDAWDELALRYPRGGGLGAGRAEELGCPGWGHRPGAARRTLLT